MGYVKLPSAGGISVKINGLEYNKDLNLRSVFRSRIGSMDNMSNFSYGDRPVVHNSKIYYLHPATYGSSYTWDGTTFSTISMPFPYSGSGFSVVNYNNEIHILGGGGSTTQNSHYRWNGTNWESVSTLPYAFVDGCAVVYNNEIHILGGNNSGTNHYKWNGFEWILVSTLPYTFARGAATVVFAADRIVIGGGQSGSTYYNNLYMWDGLAWTSIGPLPTKMAFGSLLDYKGELILVSGSLGDIKHCMWSWNGVRWKKEDVVLEKLYYGNCVCEYQDKIVAGPEVAGSNEYKALLEIYKMYEEVQ